MVKSDFQSLLLAQMEFFLLAVFRDVIRRASMTLNDIASVLPLLYLCWPRLLTVWLLSRRYVILLGQLIFLQHKYSHWSTQLQVNCMKFLKASDKFFCSLVCHNAQIRLRNWNQVCGQSGSLEPFWVFAFCSKQRLNALIKILWDYKDISPCCWQLSQR